MRITKIGQPNAAVELPPAVEPPAPVEVPPPAVEPQPVPPPAAPAVLPPRQPFTAWVAAKSLRAPLAAALKQFKRWTDDRELIEADFDAALADMNSRPASQV